MCTVFRQVGNSRSVIFGYKNSQLSLYLDLDDHVPVLCSAQVVVGFLVNLRTVAIASVCYIWDSFLWPYGTPAGRDIAVIFWKYIQTFRYLN